MWVHKSYVAFFLCFVLYASLILSHIFESSKRAYPIQLEIDEVLQKQRKQPQPTYTPENE